MSGEMLRALRQFSTALIAIFGDGDMNAPVSYLRRFEDFKGFKHVPVRRIPVNDDGTDTSGQQKALAGLTVILLDSPDSGRTYSSYRVSLTMGYS